MWSNRLTFVLECWLLGLTFALGCSGKTVNNSATGPVDNSFEAGADAAAGQVSEAGAGPDTKTTGNRPSSSEGAETTTADSEWSTPAPTTIPTPTSTIEPLPTQTSSDTTTSTGFWRCFTRQYGDGVCDCGCGILDIDCAASGDIDLCENCDSGCNASQCPGRINPEDTAECIRISPPEWTCNDSWYSDGIECHCGCGVADPDCEGSGVEVCDDCNKQGSCSNGACPGSIDPADNTQCWLAEGWTCFEGYFGDGLCTCGCGAQDPDCSSLSLDVCLSCVGCNNEGCPGTIDETDNRICTGPPYSWTCDDRYYNDGQLCNCGCGVADPDCESTDVEACDACNFTGSCSRQDCPGTIHPTLNAYCHQPEPPAEWTCYVGSYGDGWCDCGCGALDVDCPSDDISECNSCCGGYACPSRVNPENITECLPVPNEWTCGEWAYGDSYTCDCGCGAHDPDCDTPSADACESCPYDYGNGNGGCSRDGACDTIVADDNAHCIDDAPPAWTCAEEYFADGDACDCGCGAVDLDCEGDASLDACDICNAEGSCSATGCNNNPTIEPENNATCVTEDVTTAEPASSTL